MTGPAFYIKRRRPTTFDIHGPLDKNDDTIPILRCFYSACILLYTTFTLGERGSKTWQVSTLFAWSLSGYDRLIGIGRLIGLAN